MTDHQQSPEQHELWGLAYSCAKTLLSIKAAIRNSEQFIEQLAAALRNPYERRAALILLGTMDVEYTISLANDLCVAVLSHRDTLMARELLGRLPHSDAAHILPPIVWAHLDKINEDDAYRRFAELFDHLGLSEALDELDQRALKSSDPNIREVGEDYCNT